MRLTRVRQRPSARSCGAPLVGSRSEDLIDRVCGMASHHNWRQFSMRGCFVVVTIFAACFGWTVGRARKQHQAAKAIEAIGGVVQYDWQGDISEWQTVSRSRFVPSDLEPIAPAWARELIGADFFQNATGVIFRTREAEYYTTKGSRLTRVFGPSKIRTAEIEAMIPRLRDLSGLRTIYLVRLSALSALIKVQGRQQVPVFPTIPSCQRCPP